MVERVGTFTSDHCAITTVEAASAAPNFLPTKGLHSVGMTKEKGLEICHFKTVTCSAESFSTRVIECRAQQSLSGLFFKDVSCFHPHTSRNEKKKEHLAHLKCPYYGFAMAVRRILSSCTQRSAPQRHKKTVYFFYKRLQILVALWTFMCNFIQVVTVQSVACLYCCRKMSMPAAKRSCEVSRIYYYFSLAWKQSLSNTLHHVGGKQADSSVVILHRFSIRSPRLRCQFHGRALPEQDLEGFVKCF